MSTLVLARKYRSRNFGEMVGQDHVVQALSNALARQRLHHAYLFTGTRGVGKTTVSRILAKCLNCQGPDGQGQITAEPCGVCHACCDIDSGRFADYTELDAASNRGVDEVQQLLEQAVYKPVVGRFKVFMIDEVHMLTGHAFNAMLKTLEEPPEYLKFVLATTDPQKVPVTVLSRCLQFNLRPMAQETVREHLARVLAAEAVPAEPGALRLLARAARGSMRDALSLTDQAIAFGAGRVEEAAVRQMLGSVDRAHVVQIAQALARGDGAALMRLVDGLREQGLSAAATLDELCALLQRLAVIQLVPEAPQAPGDDPQDSDALARLAADLAPDEVQLLYRMALHGRAELGLAGDEYAGLAMVLLRYLAFAVPAEKKTLAQAEAAPPAPPAPDRSPAAPTPAVPAAAKEHAAPAGRRLPVVGVVPQQQAPAPHPPAPREPAQLLGVPVREQPEPSREAGAARAGPLVPSPDGDFWHGVVTQLVATEAVSALVRELALQSQLVARDHDQWQLRIERESLNQGATRERLAQALAAAGHPVRLAVEVGTVTDSPALRNQQLARERQAQAEAALMADPFVQQMMSEFGAKIVPGSIKHI